MTAPKEWIWNTDRYQLAKDIAEGATYREAGANIGLAESTVKVYMEQVPEFRAYVDKVTMENEMASRAGTIRMLIRVAKEKLPNAGNDKDTFLDYLKFMQELYKDEFAKDLDLVVTFK